MLSVCRYQLLDYNTVSHHFHLSTVTGSGKSDWLTKKQYVAVSLRTHSGRDLDGLCAFVCRSNKNKNCTAAHSNQFHSMPLFINIWMARISLSLSLAVDFIGGSIDAIILVCCNIYAFGPFEATHSLCWIVSIRRNWCLAGHSILRRMPAAKNVIFLDLVELGRRLFGDSSI